jgi:hypothetical protein
MVLQTDTFSALSSHPMRCLGLGVRAKAIAMVHVNVYSVVRLKVHAVLFFI